MRDSGAPVRVLSTGHTGITVSDLDRSIRFYRDLLGCEVSAPVRAEGPFFEAVTGVPGCQIDVAFARVAGHVIELLCYRNPPSKASTLRACDPGFMHVCLKVADLGRVVNVIRSSGKLVEVVEVDYRRNVMSGMRWTNEWVRDAEQSNREFLFVIQK